MTRDEQPKVAIVRPQDEIDPQIRQMMQMQGMQVPPEKDNFSFLSQILKHEEYDVSLVDFEQKQPIPDDVDTVVVVNPRRWDERQRWEINRALNSGKSVILAVQSYVQDYKPTARTIEVSSQEVPTGINEWLENFGLKVSKDFLMDQQSEVLSIQGGQRMGPFQMSTPVELPTHILLTSQSANPDISISSQLSSIFYLWGTSININEDKLKENGLKSTVLLKSGKESWTVPFHSGALKRSDIEVPNTFEPGQPLAVLVEGQFPNVYEGQERPKWPEPPQMPNQPPPPAPPEEGPARDLPAKPGRLLLVGCSNVWQDDFIRSGGNMMFFINSVDALTLGEELIHVRSKTKVDRMIEEKLSNGQRLWYRFFATGLAPVILALIGIIRIYSRRRAKDLYLQEVASA